MSEIEVYLEEIKVFQAITPIKAQELLEDNMKHIVYIGRETCPYCRRFVGKLSKLAKEKQLTIYYVHAQDPDYPTEIQAFRNKYGVATVPGLLYSDEAGIKVKCDSSMSPDEIMAFVNV